MPSIRPIRFAGIAIAGMSLIVAVTPALARVPHVVVTASPDRLITHVRYDDLNLATATGQGALQHRLGGAINQLCERAMGQDRGSTLLRPAMVRCSKSAWDEARPQVANAVQRARDIALTGSSPIQAAAIQITGAIR